MGMLCNVVTALDLGSLDELWGDWRFEPERAAFVASLGTQRT